MLLLLPTANKLPQYGCLISWIETSPQLALANGIPIVLQREHLSNAAIRLQHQAPGLWKSWQQVIKQVELSRRHNQAQKGKKSLLFQVCATLSIIEPPLAMAGGLITN